MINIILSYWWILLLLLLFLAVITKNLIKFFLAILIFIIALIIFWYLFIKVGFSRSAKCFEESNRTSDLSYSQALRMNPGDERNNYICEEQVIAHNNLMTCILNVKSANSFGFGFFSKSTSFNKNITDSVLMHNKSCPRSPLVIPSL